MISVVIYPGGVRRALLDLVIGVGSPVSSWAAGQFRLQSAKVGFFARVSSQILHSQLRMLFVISYFPMSFQPLASR